MFTKIKKRNFVSDESGNVAIMFAVSLMAMLAASGLALDVTDMHNRKSTLQSASDAAVLAAAVSDETNIQRLKKIAETAFESNFVLEADESIKEFDLNLSEDEELSLNVQLEKPTLMMGIAGFDAVDVKVQSATLLANSTPLDIAFVLDRTGSMAGQNMSGLINASRELITDLDASERDIRIAVIPFSDYVNVGANGIALSLLDFPATATSGSDVMCTMADASSSGCTSGTSSGGTSGTTTTTSGSCTTTGGGTCTVVTTTSSTSGSSTTTMTWTDVSTSSTGAFCTISSDPQESSGSLIEECTPVVPTENWFGCVGSREAPYNLTAGFEGQKFPPVYDRTCGEPMVPLTDDLITARVSIDDLTASGSTYIPAGLQWGWRALDPSVPFDSQQTSDRNKLLILMTDGQNTRSQDGILHTGFDFNAADVLTADLCESIKRNDIQIATVSYSNGGSGAANTAMLESCASSKGLFYEARNAISLRRAFESAINQANNIRLTR